MATLEALQTKRAQLDAQIKRARAQEAHKSRAQDTRRKVIFGATALKLCKQDKTMYEKIFAAIPEKEKKLFNAGMQNTLAAVQELREGKGTSYESLETMRAALNAEA